MKPRTNEEVEKIYQDLLASCEKAFRKEVNSAEIYEFMMKTLEDNDKSFWWRLTWMTRTFRRFFWTLILLLLLLVGVLYTLENVFNTSYLSMLFPGSACLLPSHPIVMEVTRPITNCSICQEYQKSGSPLIEFNYQPTSAEFEEIAYSSKPIIVRGGAYRTGMSTTFNFETLKSIFESVPGSMESVMDECQFLPFRSSFNDLKEVFATVSSDVTYYKTPWYIGWSNCHPEIVEKLRELFPRPKFLPKYSESSVIDWIFIGSPGFGAAMHLDYVRRPSWQAQLSGSKRWTLKPPPECESVCSWGVSFSIKSGDLLFLDTNSWYHETFIEDNQLSISIGSEYD